MSINIIDNFSVNVSKAIDSRMVVANAAARIALIYTYDGLKVFQQDDRKTYVWNSLSSSWSVDNEIVLNDGYVPKSNGIGITNSNIYSTASNVGINTNDPKEVLQLNDPLGFTEPLTFHFSSESIMGYNWYYNGSEQRFNPGGSSVIRFNSSGEILFSPFSATGSLNAIGGPSTMRINPLTGVEVDAPIILNGSQIYAPSANVLVFTNTSEIFRLSGDRVLLSNGTLGNPILSFSNSTSTGIYSPATNSIAISTNGSTSMLMNTSKSLIAFGGSTVSVSATNSSIFIQGSPLSYQSLVADKVKFGVNDIFANIHDIGPGGIGESGNAPYSPDGFGSGLGPWNYPSIASGLFTTATVADSVNITGGAPGGYTTWMRVGNVVSVSGQIAFNVTAANTGSSFTVTLPIKSFLGANNHWQLNGIGKILNTSAGLNIGGGDVACIQASVVGDRAQFNFRPTSTGSKTMMYHYQYLVATYINSPPPPGPPPAP